MEKEEYIDFSFSPYCLASLLLALDNEGIKQFSITKEDSDLHIRISKKYLQSVVYRSNDLISKFNNLYDEEE